MGLDPFIALYFGKTLLIDSFISYESVTSQDNHTSND